MTEASGYGHGKAILVGEHHVLDGATAVAIGLPWFRTDVTLGCWGSGPLTVSFEAGTDLGGTWAEDTRKMLTKACTLADVDADVTVAIRSNVPLGRGLGSSAALAVAAVRAAHRLATGAAPDGADLLADAREVECIVHGRSSGLDPAAAAGTGAVLFRGGGILDRVPIACTPALLAARWVLLDLGVAASTRTAIEAAQTARGRLGAEAVRSLRDRTTAAAAMAASALERGDVDALAEALTTAGACLEPLGVVDGAMRVVLDAAIDSGARAAKQTGAGMGGMLLALCADAGAAERVRAATRNLTAGQWVLTVAPDAPGANAPQEPR
ncbi:MAG: hypothetical protein EXR79_01510 [Myxococcales bacterium]|nr:hypothetical protein [Myxococcales bacterium]